LGTVSITAIGTVPIIHIIQNLTRRLYCRLFFIRI